MEKESPGLWDRITTRTEEHEEPVIESPDGPSSAFSSAGILAIVALALVIAGSLYLHQRDSANQMKAMSLEIARLSELAARSERRNSQADMAMARAELARSLAAVDKIIALGDPKLNREAFRLRLDISKLMAEFDGAEPEEAPPAAPEQAVEPIPQPNEDSSAGST